MRVPLAWLNLLHDRGRLLLAVLGIAFAVLLMSMQVGFRYALLDSTVELARRFDAELIVVNRLRYALPIRETFARRRLLQAAAVPGIASADPFYLRVALRKHPREPFRRPIRLLAYDVERRLLALPETIPFEAALRRPGTVLIDAKSNVESFGPPAAGVVTELAGQRIETVGTFTLGKDFANEGNLIADAETFRRLLAPTSPGNPLDRVDVGLIRLVPGTDPAQALAALTAALPDDVRVMSKQAFVDMEAGFWLDATPIGTVFLIGLAIGFLVGVIICYQILYVQVSHHLKEFATLKAMGYRDRYFVGVVLQQSLILSLLGFAAGTPASLWLYGELAQRTGLLLQLTPGRAGIVLAATTTMCFLSGLLAVRKVRVADPAELF